AVLGSQGVKGSGGEVLAADQMLAADPSAERLAVLESLGVHAAADNAQVVRECRTVLLAVKPQTLEALGEALSRLDAERQVVISIMAGLSSQKIEAVIGRPARIVRVMPNTPLMVGRGMTGVALGAHARPGDEALAM